jgi:fibronectin type 3 domain-containing protein
MWVNWKRFTFGAMLLASLSLLLFGCGGLGGSQTAQKPISGVVSDPVTGLALADAKVVAYAIDANGVKSSVPLSTPQSVQSNYKGRYQLSIPANYTGSVMIEATKPASTLAKIAKVLFNRVATDVDIQAAVPQKQVSMPSIPPVMVSFATNMVVQYMVVQAANNAAAFSPDNIQKATLILETFFGANFTQTAPPTSATDGNISKAQQDLIVSIQGINAFTSGSSVTAVIEALNQSTGMLEVADAIKTGIAAAVTSLASQGILPIGFTASPAIITSISNAQFSQVAIPDVSDVTAPAAPAGLAVVSVSANRVNLSWNRSAESDASGYLVCRSDASGGYASVGGAPQPAAGPVSFSDFTAAPGTAYSYQVIAFDSTHNLSEASAAVSASTPAAADNVPPTVPAGLVCKGSNDKQVNLQWLQSTKTKLDGTVLPAASYNVYRDGQLVASSSDTSYIDSSVVQSTSYSYTVKASDADANLSAASQPVVVRTSATPGAVIPLPPTFLHKADLVTFKNVSLTWTASATADSAQVTYNVYRDAVLIASGITVNSYNDDSVTPVTSYLYTVTAVAATVESVPTAALSVATLANPALVDNTAPTVPSNLSVVSATGSSVALAWAASSKLSGDQIVAGYDVWRGDGQGNGYLKIATVAQPFYTDATTNPTNLNVSMDYSYKVLSFNSAGVRSAASLPVGVTTPKPIDFSDHTAPAAPGGLTAIPTSDAIALTWTPSTDADLAGYLVFRDGAQIADVHNQSFFTDTATTPATSYNYSIRAYDNSGNTSLSGAALTAATLAPIPGRYNISGKVSLNGVGQSFVSVVLSDGTNSTTFLTDQNGNYTFSGLASGSYSVTPTPAGYFQFTPVSRTVALGSANAPGLDFAAVLTGSANFSSIGYPSGTIIGGISYPAGSVIGGVTYPTGATVIGGVVYPTGAVIGGILYPNGVVIGGVSYPAGTIVGGIAFPIGIITSGVTFPSGTIIGGTSYPAGSVIGGVTYPTGATVIGGVVYPTGIVIGGAVYPSGVVIGGVSYPSGTIIGGIAYPSGTITSGLSFPGGTVIGGVLYPAGSVVANAGYPSGVMVGGVFYPSGTVTGGVMYPSGGVSGSASYPVGSTTAGVVYPYGSILVGGSFPTSGANGSVTYGDITLTSALNWLYAVSGKVSFSGVGLAGATIAIPGTPYVTTTDSLGNYLLNLPAGSYGSITASLSSYSFPAVGTFTVDSTLTSFTGNFAGVAIP